ncbi:hypothetical protein ES332_D11G269900v1 [Gossypium tomentosum]|uniref:RNase H type-1 domain-containing protein n=1 Tax=Gossypium tomentosum TaxID=34277 RepID=A0A5D2IT23_GOSTO|nr:hypothetical protein ES332_D11G269900v1 [Gossypium tomentosum]
MVLCIPLAWEAHDDLLVWGEEGSGVYSVRSGYRLLQASDSTITTDSYRLVYKKLWKLQLLGKMKKHIFRDCPSVAGVWDDLQITWPIDFVGISFQDWFFFLLDIVLVVSKPTVFRQIVCALWYIWHARNQHVHPNAIVQVQDIVRKVICYLRKLDVVQERLPGRLIGVERWRPPEGTMLKVIFDAAFSTSSMLSCTGIVIRDNLGRVLGSHLVLTVHVPMAFATEALTCSHVVRLAGDSLSVIRRACFPLHNVSAIEASIWDVKAMVSSFHHCLFAHIPREGNTIVHLLATTRLCSGGSSFLSGVIPSFASLAVEWDRRDIDLNENDD